MSVTVTAGTRFTYSATVSAGDATISQFIGFAWFSGFEDLDWIWAWGDAGRASFHFSDLWGQTQFARRCLLLETPVTCAPPLAGS